MLHRLIVRAAELSGELPLLVLIVISIASVAIISDRVVYFVRQRLDFDLFARDLLQLIRADDWPKARQLAGRYSASAAAVLAAGLSQVERGPAAARAAMRSVRTRERMRLDGQLGVLAALGRAAMLVGVLGTMFDLIRLPHETAGRAEEWFAALAPTAAGLLVAIPAMLVAGYFRRRIRDTLRQTDSLANLLLLQLRAERRTAVAPQQPRSRAA